MRTAEEVLAHAQVYDPAARRARYLRTRQLKGRQPGLPYTPRGPRIQRDVSDAALRKSRRAELLVQKEALEKRLERLKEVLRQLVEDSKKRSGVKTEEKESTPSSSSSNKDEKSPKSEKPTKLTEAQKRDKRKDSKERYEEERRTSLARNVKSLQGAIKDVQAKIEKAEQKARQKPTKSSEKTAPSRR